MKKAFVIILAAMMVLTFAFSVSAYDAVNVYKAKTAPVIDGVVSSEEYDTVLTYDADNTLWEQTDDEASAYDCTIYLAWDEDYLYFAFTAESPATGRTFSNTDFLATPPYIFDRLSVMTAMTYTDPATEVKFIPENGTSWDWGKAANSSWAREWTISMQPNGDQLNANHFGTVTTNANFSYKVASANGLETYEQRIPWAAIDDGDNKVNNTVGGKVGFAIAAVVEEVSENSGLYCTFGKGINEYKNFAEYATLTLADEKPADESTGTETPDTGDSFAFFAIFGVVALAAAVVVVKKARR